MVKVETYFLEMAKNQKGKGGKAKSPKKALTDGPLPKAMTRVRNKCPPPAAAQPVKVQTSGFLAYLYSAMKCKSADISTMACDLQKRYRAMTPEGKKLVVQEFFRNGGKKQGLTATFQQEIENNQKSADLGWSGYCTVGMVMDFFKVCQTLSP